MKALLYADIKDLKFKYIYRFIAFRRSGQHAIFEWLANNLDANVILVNNISGQKDSITLLNGDKIENKLNILFISIEDFDFKTEENKTYKSYIFDETILILRDQYNLFASRIKSNRKRFFTEYALYLYNQHLGLKDKYFTIEYNKWLIDDAYLKALKNKFNLLDIKK